MKVYCFLFIFSVILLSNIPDINARGGGGGRGGGFGGGRGGGFGGSRGGKSYFF